MNRRPGDPAASRRGSSARRRHLRALACACALSRGGLASCPDFETVPYCSGHGDCTPTSSCACWPGFQAADCSERTCPTGPAWSDAATARDTAHAATECSNRGVCNRISGRCTCDFGFEGAACDRLTCPGVDDSENPLHCSGHGICASMHDLAQNSYSTDSAKYTYDSVWDAGMVRGCVCTEQWAGVACAERECALGDDPLTSGQVNEVQLLSCAGFNWFTLRWEGHETGRVVSTFKPIGLQDALESVPGIGKVKVTYANPDQLLCYPEGVDESKYQVAVIEFETRFGVVPPLVVADDGQFSGTIITRSIGKDGEGALIRNHAEGYELAVACTKEAAVCARRGVCNDVTGSCECYTSNFELYGSSDLYGGPGLRGDCGLPLTDITACPGETECSDNGLCRGSGTVVEDDATPFPTMSAPKGDWQAAAPYSCACIETFREGNCARRTCPRGRTWFSYPSADETAHDAVVECSNAGDCDRLTGLCRCAEPFEGAACEAMKCPIGAKNGRVCNGKGTCLSMRDLALRAETNGEVTPLVYGDRPNEPGTWDADRIAGCLCDDGWTGHACALRSCPLGDDPHTRGQANEVQYLACAATAGTFALSFRSHTTIPLAFDAPAAAVKAALEALPTVGIVAVTYGDPGSVGLCNATYRQNVVRVDFDTEHSNVPALKMDASRLTRATATSTLVRVAVAADGTTLAALDGAVYTAITGTTEALECSGRGLCDRKTGLCECFRGYGMSDGKGGPGCVDDCGYHLPIYTKPA